MKNKALILLTLLTMAHLPSIHAVTKDQAAGVVAIDKEDQKVLNRLFKAINDLNVDDAQLLFKENDRIKPLVSSYRQKGKTALDKVKEKLKENSASSLSRGEKAAVTRKLHMLESMLQEEAAPKARSRRTKTERSSEMRAMPAVE